MNTYQIDIEKYSSYEEMKEFLNDLRSDLNQVPYSFPEKMKFIIYRDLTKYEFTAGNTEDCDIYFPEIFNENFIIKCSGLICGVLFPSSISTPENYLSLVSRSINLDTIYKTDNNDRLCIPETQLYIKTIPEKGFLGLFVPGNHNNQNGDEDYFYRLGIEMLRAAFLVQQTGMEMSL